MKKFALIMILFVLQFGYAQGTRFVYQVTEKTDSTDAASVRSELANLDISGQKSVFYSQNRLKRDSIMQKMRAMKSFDGAQLTDLRSNMNYTVEKDVTKNNIIYKDRIGRDQYAYPETEKMVWKILPDIEKIGDYKAQKAETYFGGRTWYAWFAAELPFQDGPYKFSGLPGLIVRVQDKDSDYTFGLVQVKKISALPEFSTRGQVVTLSKAKYKDIYKKFQSDPEAYFAASQNQNRGGFSRAGNGASRPPGSRGGRQDPEARQRHLDEIKNTITR